MKRDQVKADILKYIKEKDHVTYVEVERIFESNNYEYKGDFRISSGINRAVVFWAGWNKDAMQIINELREEELIGAEPTQPICYLIDGDYLNLPLVKGVGPYTEDHWLPIVFRPVK